MNWKQTWEESIRYADTTNKLYNDDTIVPNLHGFVESGIAWKRPQTFTTNCLLR